MCDKAISNDILMLKDYLHKKSTKFNFLTIMVKYIS